MIFYYSATGNTRYAAKFIGSRLDTEVIDMLTFQGEIETTDPDEPIGFMFPIYCWGIPPVIKKFISRVAPQLGKSRYVWAVCTCGDEAGIAMRLFNRILQKSRGREADAVFSLIMPNTYVLLPGFDVDPLEVEQRKLKAAPERLEKIITRIGNGDTGIYDVHEGSLPFFRTYPLYPLFVRWGVFPSKWHVSESCIHCSKCSKVCPACNIEMKDGHPAWGKNCYSCCACYHICPAKAISYGSITKNKSQYFCPLS